jgi:hypothetical protein
MLMKFLKKYFRSGPVRSGIDFVEIELKKKKKPRDIKWNFLCYPATSYRGQDTLFNYFFFFCDWIYI